MRTYVQMTRYFFDRPRVMRAVGEGAARGLGRWGAYIRRRARSSIRMRKRSSNPGEPPSAHTTEEPNLRTILFAYDINTKSMVVGPVRLNQVDNDASMRPVSGLVPPTLEKGGDIIISEWQPSPGANWLRRDKRFRRRYQGKPTRNRRVRIAARPFMGPATNAEMPNAPSYFVNVIKP